MHDHFLQKSNDVICSKDILKALKADNFLYLRGVDITEYLSADASLLEKRSRVLRDTAEVPGLHALVDEWIAQITYLSEMVKKKSEHASGEESLYSVKQLELYFSIVDTTCAYAEEHAAACTSSEYQTLFEAFLRIADTEYNQLKVKTKKLLDQISQIKSISIGFNFDASLTPYEAGILSVNQRYIESGTLIDRLLRGDTGQEYCSIAPLVVSKRQIGSGEFDVLEHALYTGIDKLFKKQLRQWEPEILTFLQNRLGFLLDILPDLQFISEITAISERMRSAGLQLCKPEYSVFDTCTSELCGFYHPVLALNFAEHRESTENTIVKNDITFDQNGMLYILTGPNNGGKSVYLSAVVLIQLMAQLGMMVPAEKAVLTPVHGIFVHFPKHGSLHEMGRLAEECETIAAIFSALPKRKSAPALVVMDEAFSSTDAKDAIQLSDTVLRALSHCRVRGIYATHFHELYEYAEAANAARGPDDSPIDYLVAGIDKNETRTYRIERRKPDGKSYAQTIAQKYGILYETLIQI
ncbi:MAG: hypothetical protein J6I50_01360 [Clostridia bacterium]|nr:hypothetical protein [Clostridia bacterium]